MSRLRTALAPAGLLLLLHCAPNGPPIWAEEEPVWEPGQAMCDWMLDNDPEDCTDPDAECLSVVCVSCQADASEPALVSPEIIGQAERRCARRSEWVWAVDPGPACLPVGQDGNPVLIEDGVLVLSCTEPNNACR